MTTDKTPRKRKSLDGRRRASEAKAIERAAREAFSAASTLAGGDMRAAYAVFHAAEREIIRQHVIGAMGAAAYWNAVKADIHDTKGRTR